MANISQLKRQKMLAFLDKLKSAHQDDDSLRAIGEIETALNEKKYGLVWEKHTEKVDEELLHNIPVFLEDETRKIVADKDNEYNFLLEGDNLHSLKLLEKTHKGKIDVIYIDPPYNTGNKDFIYNDSFVDKTDGYSHSKWLSFMSERLEIARELLSDGGVIFISIDDNEQAQLKLLCDEVFGEENFVSTIIWRRKRGRDNSAKWFSKSHEYSVVYARNKSLFNIKKLVISEESVTRKAYNNPDNDKRGDYRKLACWARGTQGGVSYSYSMNDGYVFSERLWLFSQKKLKEMENDNKLLRVKDNLYRKHFLSEHTGQVPETLWDDVSNSANASDMIKNIFGGKIVFETAKPLEYIMKMVRLFPKSNATILDFFAGSYVIIMTVVKSLIKSRVLVLLQNIKTLKNNNLCVV